MSTFWQKLAAFEQREQFYVEASAENGAASALLANESEITAFVDAEAPQGVAALVAAIEKADAKFPEGPLVNVLLNSAETELDAQIAPLVAQGVALVPAAAQALQANAKALQAKAAAL